MASPPRPLKRLGQHFLVDPNIVRKIVATAALQSHDTVLEIGPGRGILTAALCASAKTVTAVEVDRQLVAYLNETLGRCGNLDLRHGDALEFPYDTLPEGTVVVANLPYYVSTPILFKLLGSGGRIARMVLMLQTEVARRLSAMPGSRDYGILSVLTQRLAEVSLAFHVSPACFRPQPDVGSSVVSLTVRKQPFGGAADEQRFVRIVKAAFAHRRKTLANSLRDEGLPMESIGAAFAEAGIDPTRRAETLTVEEFAVLAMAWRSAPDGRESAADL